MHFSYFLWLLFFLPPNEIPSEKLHFDVVRNDKTIGELTAIRTAEEGLITYKSYTRINAHILKKIAVLFQAEVTMKQDQLNSSDASIEVNGKTRDRTQVTWTGDKYHIQTKGKREKWLSDPIAYPAILLLFEEPIDVETSFFEETANFHPLYPMGNHSYKKINAKGKENWYYYEKGKLQRAVVDAGIVRFEMILRD